MKIPQEPQGRSLHPWANEYNELSDSCYGLKKEWLKKRRFQAILELMKIPETTWNPSKNHAEDSEIDEN